MEHVEPIAGGSVLEALYREASTRRHTAERTQAEVLAADSARRAASKLSASSALMTTLRLSREVEHVFKQNSVADTGLLTRAQLQAALHSLGLLASRPPAFSTSLRRGAAVHPSTPSARRLRRDGSIVDSLWQLLTGAQSECMSVPQRTKAVSLRPGKCRSSSQLLQPDQAVANEAESCDTLLSQGIDLWQQLIGKANFSHTPAHAADSQASSMPLPVNAAEPTPDVPLSISPAQSMFSATDQPSHQKLQVKADAKSNMHGVSLQQLLAFVQLMQQHSSGSQTVHPAVNLQTGRTERQNADLDKLARVCSQNKQANMAYMGIGNSRVQQQSLRQWRSVHDRASGVSAHHAGKQQKQQPALIHKWQPRESAAKREGAAVASQSVRFSRRNFRQRRQQLQHTLKQQVVRPVLHSGAAARHKPHTSELGKQQPFGRSESTAANVMERRQALAELEMLPCTFSPALDPHSLALVAAQASAYRPPQKATLPRRRSTHTADLGIHINSVSSTGIDSGQEAGTAAESTWASVAIRPDGFAHSPVRYAVTSRDMQEERALKECTFAPMLNPSNTAKSIVAQTWKSMLAAYQRQHDLQAVSHGLNASQEGNCLKEGSVDETVNAAVLHARDGKSSVPSDTHKGTQSSQYQTASDVRQNSSLRRALSRRHCHNSYAVAARKGRGGAAAVCSAVPVGAMQQQPYVGRTGSCAESEAQLQADVAACDKRLEQCMAASQIKRLSQKGLRGCPGVAAAGGAGHQKDNLSNHSSGGQLQQSALKIVIEAELADGSASKFEVQEADQLRHLTSYFATMMELQSTPLPGHSQATAVA